MKKIRVHSCFDIEKESLPDSCACEHRITISERDARIESGALRAIPDTHGKQVVIKYSSATKRIWPRLPRTATVEKAQIERAYVKGSEYERKRIELFRWPLNSELPQPADVKN